MSLGVRSLTAGPFRNYVVVATTVKPPVEYVSGGVSCRLSNMFSVKLSRAVAPGPHVAQGENAYACNGVTGGAYFGWVPVFPAPEHVSAKSLIGST